MVEAPLRNKETQPSPTKNIPRNKKEVASDPKNEGMGSSLLHVIFVLYLYLSWLLTLPREGSKLGAMAERPLVAERGDLRASAEGATSARLEGHMELASIEFIGQREGASLGRSQEQRQSSRK